MEEAFSGDGGASKPSKHEMEALQEIRTKIFDEYNEVAIQYGYLVLFAVAFPLGPLLALLNNVIEIHGDAFKALQVQRRDFQHGAQDIGQWGNIFNMVNIVGLINNITLLAFSSKIFAAEGIVVVHNLTSGAVIPSSTFEHDASDPKQSFEERNTGSALFTKLMIIFFSEHLVFLFKFFLSDFIESKSEYTRDCADRLRKKQDQVIKSVQEKQVNERRIQLGNRERYDLLNEVIVDGLEDTLVQRWRQSTMAARALSDQEEDESETCLAMTRRCTQNDYVQGMHLYKDDSWASPAFLLDREKKGAPRTQQEFIHET